MSDHIIVGMSGGVDSSVATLKLLELGYRVTGLFMKNWEEDDDNGQCTATQDLEDAQQVCDQLDVPLKTVNFSSEYWDNVFENFLSEYRAGRTPNPDILCNKYIKFREFLDFSLELGADYIATGHYARVCHAGKYHQLRKGLDANKDQSYFLYTLGQPALQKCIFPLGDMEKPEVRKLAEKADFGNSKKKDSTGICFIGERKFRDFLSRFLPAQPGEIQTPEGRTIGVHTGLMYYTLGQRQGLGIGGVRGRPEAPWFVLEKDLQNNVLVVGQGHSHPGIMHNALIAAQCDWVRGDAPADGFRCKAKIRYRQADQACRIEPLGNGRYQIFFDCFQRAITPGQSVVLYHGDECIGGGIIEKAIRSGNDRSARIQPESSSGASGTKI